MHFGRLWEPYLFYGAVDLEVAQLIPSLFSLSYRILGRLFIDSSTCNTGSNPQGTGVFVLSIDKVDGLMACSP